MNGENWLLVTDKPAEFEKQAVEVQDFRRITHHFTGIYRIYLKSIRKNPKVTAWNRLDLGTLGFWPIMPKNLLFNWST